MHLHFGLMKTFSEPLEEHGDRKKYILKLCIPSQNVGSPLRLFIKLLLPWRNLWVHTKLWRPQRNFAFARKTFVMEITFQCLVNAKFLRGTQYSCKIMQQICEQLQRFLWERNSIAKNLVLFPSSCSLRAFLFSCHFLFLFDIHQVVKGELKKPNETHQSWTQGWIYLFSHHTVLYWFHDFSSQYQTTTLKHCPNATQITILKVSLRECDPWPFFPFWKARMSLLASVWRGARMWS